MLRSSDIAKTVATAFAVAVAAGLTCSAAFGAPIAADGANLAPDGLAVNASGDVFVSDRQNDVVDMITPSGELSLEAGVPGQPGRPTPGPATSSDLSDPTGLAVDAVGDLYIADAGKNQVVEEVTPSGQLSVVAGNPRLKDEAVKPGPANESELSGAVDVAVDQEGDLYVDDLLHAVVEKVTPAGLLSIAAGTSDTFGPPEPSGFLLSGLNGYPEAFSATSSEFLFLAEAIAEDQGDLYIADSGAHVVERVNATGEAEVIAGDGSSGAPSAGLATESPLQEPTGLAIDASGNIYIADPVNNVVEKVSPEGELSVVAGDGTRGTPTPGSATASDLDAPVSVAVDAGGDLYIADLGNNAVEKVEPNGNLSIFAGSAAGQQPPTPPEHTQCTDQALTGTYVNVTVTPGHGCVLKGADVEGNLVAKGATNLTVGESKIGGRVTVHAATGAISLSESTIGRGLDVEGATGAVSITGSTVGRNAKIDHNEGPVTVQSNHVTGALTVTSNAGSPESTIVLGNTVGGKVSCTSDPDLAVACNAGGSAGKP